MLILPKLKYFLIWSKSWFRFSAKANYSMCHLPVLVFLLSIPLTVFFLLRLELELCPGSSLADYGGVSLFPLTTKYLEKFNGNHTNNLENPILRRWGVTFRVTVLRSSFFKLLSLAVFFPNWGFSSNLIRKRADQLHSNGPMFFLLKIRLLYLLQLPI